MEENAPRRKYKRKNKWIFQGEEKSEHKQVCVPSMCAFSWQLFIFLFSVFLAFTVTMFKTVKWWEILTAKLKTVTIL